MSGLPGGEPPCCRVSTLGILHSGNYACCWKRELCLRWLKTVTSADGSYLQVKRGMFRMTASFRKVFLRLMGGSNLHYTRIWTAVTVMRAQAALALLNMKHRVLPIDS
jgi:hypothetical protein